jgi:hypothetical protein
MRLTLNYAATVLLTLTVLLVGVRVDAQDQAGPSPEQPSVTNAQAAPGEGSSMSEGTQQAPSSLNGDQQSAATKALCSALSGQYKDAATAGVSALTNPQVLLAAATNYSSVMHVSVSSATTLLKGYATQHATEILSSCAFGNATQGASAAVPNVSGVTSGVPGIGHVPGMPNTP